MLVKMYVMGKKTFIGEWWSRGAELGLTTGFAVRNRLSEQPGSEFDGYTQGTLTSLAIVGKITLSCGFSEYSLSTTCSPTISLIPSQSATKSAVRPTASGTL